MRVINWQELASPEFRVLDRDLPVVLPVAAVEQHGPQLPLATDRIIRSLSILLMRATVYCSGISTLAVDWLPNKAHASNATVS